MEKSRILITGFSGFVGRHFIKYLYENNVNCEVLGIDIRFPDYDYNKYAEKLIVNFKCIDLLNTDNLRSVFQEFIPDYILHLASFSSVAYSWEHPTESFANNTNIFCNLLTVVKEFNQHCRILSVGSSECYGNVIIRDLPLKETHVLKPVSPYAVARVAQEMLSQVFVESYHLDIILTRSFNHIGPWQDERFVIPGFINKILTIKESGNAKGVIETGDIEIVRDFLDVRDVVRAYYLLLMKGKTGEVYNICSGKGILLKDAVNIIADLASTEIETKVNPEYIRPNDNKAIIGTYAKIKCELGWTPQISFEKTITDMIQNIYERRLREGENNEKFS